MLLWFVIIDWIISVGIGLYAAPSKTEKIAMWGSVPGGSLYFCFAFVPMFPAYSATLRAPSVMFSENILRSLFKSLSDHQQLRMMRIVTLTFTVVVALYAMHAKASIFKWVENAYQIPLMIAGSLMPQFVQHDPHIHDHLRHGHHAAEQTHHAEHVHHHT